MQFSLFEAQPPYRGTTLNEDDLDVIIAALDAVMPTGGSSVQWTVIQKLVGLGVERDPAMACIFQRIAFSEYCGAKDIIGVVTAVGK